MFQLDVLDSFFFFFSSRRRHTRSLCDWSSDVCSSDLIYGSGKEKIRFSWNDSGGSRGEFMRPWEGLSKEIERRYQQTDSEWTREMYASFMSEQPCPTCKN